MPELPEVEAYRALAESRALGREIVAVLAPDAWYLKGGTDAGALQGALVGTQLTVARRTGKVLLLDCAAGATVALRFGMSGRLVVDGVAALDDLVYSSNAELERWDRFALFFADGGDLRMRDPRRLGGVQLHLEEARLGVDARDVAPAALKAALAGSRAPLKARLMDQSRLAGVGNLIADEALWRAGLDPAREAGALEPAELRRLHRHLVSTIEDLITDGGSHTGDLLPHRQPGGRCPKDGTPLVRSTVGGRTTWSCPKHQH